MQPTVRSSLLCLFVLVPLAALLFVSVYLFCVAGVVHTLHSLGPLCSDGKIRVSSALPVDIWFKVCECDSASVVRGIQEKTTILTLYIFTFDELMAVLEWPEIKACMHGVTSGHMTHRWGLLIGSPGSHAPQMTCMKRLA